MACATLKRSLDFDPVHGHGRPSKRQRCVPMCVSPSGSPPSAGAASHRSEAAAAAAASASASSSSSAPGPSPFADICPKMTPEMMAAGIREEIRRLHRRRQLHFNPHHQEGGGGDSSSDSAGSPPPPTFATAYSPSSRDKPLFTFRQVGIICERLLTERESQLREEYDRILNIKLSEQYDAFVKFSNDQLHRRFEVSATPSYLS